MQELWVAEKAGSDAEALAHAHRVLRYLVVRTVEDPDPLERGVDATPRRWLSGRCQDLEVLSAGQMAVEPRLIDDRTHPRQRLVAMLRHRIAEQRHRAGISLRQTEEDPDQGGLSGTVGPEVAERTSTRHEQLDVVDGDVGTEPLGQPMGLDRPTIARTSVPEDRSSGRRTLHRSIVRAAGRPCPNGFPRWQTRICAHRLPAPLNFKRPRSGPLAFVSPCDKAKHAVGECRDNEQNEDAHDLSRDLPCRGALAVAFARSNEHRAEVGLPGGRNGRAQIPGSVLSQLNVGQRGVRGECSKPAG